MAVAPTDISTLALDTARGAATEAGRMALSYFRRGGRTSADIQYKDGGSPVTEADLAVDAYLRRTLTAAAPDFGWLSEETLDDAQRLDRAVVWVVDPIDGTRAFARGDADWTVAIGIVVHGVAVAGFVFAPVSGDLYEALPGAPSLLNGRPIRASGQAGISGARIAGPGPLLDAMQADRLPFQRMPRIHSLAYRFVRVAEGAIDGGLASGSAHDWDLAAAHAILTGAGGVIRTTNGATPVYNRPSTMHEPVVAAGPGLAGPLADILARGGPARASGHKDAIAGL